MKHSPADVVEAMADETEWERPQKAPKRKSERRQRAAMVSVRLTPAELEVVQARASALGLSVGAFMRHRALEGAQGEATSVVRSSSMYFTMSAGPASPNAFGAPELPRAIQRLHSSADALVDN
jgi:predicted DNA binding CopG/RHH family protein